MRARVKEALIQSATLFFCAFVWGLIWFGVGFMLAGVWIWVSKLFH